MRGCGDTHRHQELQRAHIVALGLLELAEHAHAQAKLFLQVLGALHAAVPAALVAHGGQRDEGLARGVANCPGSAPRLRKVAASAKSEEGRATLHAGEKLGQGGQAVAPAGTATREAQGSAAETPGRRGSGPGPARPAPQLRPHTARAGGEAAPAATAVTWTLIKCFVSM